MTLKNRLHYIVLILVCISWSEIHAQGMAGKRKVVTQTTKSDSESATKKRKHSSIINDSTKNIYGPKTTLSTTEKEIFENKRNSYQPLDTLIRDLHRWDFVQRNEYKYQDLGNLGTALNSIFPQVPSVIGATPGYKVYDMYYESAEPRWYNTKSPFSRINIIWGGRGRAITKVEFSRNVHKRFNFGFNYRPILSANQLDYAGNRNYQVTSQYYDAYTSYESKNERYKILASYRRIKHHVRENGGLDFFGMSNLNPKTDSLGYQAFFNPNYASHFTVSSGSVTAYSEDYRNAFHLFHHYQLAKPAQLYHILDLSSQFNTFRTTVGGETATFFPTSFADTTAVNDVNTFKVMQNEVGIKGNAAFLFYDFYYKLRMYSNNMNNLQAQAPHAVGKESYVGARIGFRFDSLSFLSGQAEYLLDGHYKIDGTLRTPWLDADLKSSLSKPGFMQQVYRGGFNVWTNNYHDVLSNQLSGHLKLKWGPLFLSPGLTYTAYHNYVYFTHNDNIPMAAFSQQSSGSQQIVSPEVKMEIKLFNHLFIRPYLIYTKVVLSNDDNPISIPQWFANAQLCYEGFVFKNALQMQVGFDAHANAAYNAMGYDPAVQQYFIQNKYTNPSFWNVDLFLNGRIKRGRFFAKYTNLIQIFTKQGYMPTPGYPNVPNVFDFGFELILFD